MQKFTATKCAVISCNTSYRRQIDEKTLVSILKGYQNMDDWIFHVATFFNEVPEKCICGLASEHDIQMNGLAKIFYQLPEIYQEKHFKKILDATETV